LDTFCLDKSTSPWNFSLHSNEVAGRYKSSKW